MLADFLDYLVGEWKRNKGLSSRLVLKGYKRSFLLVSTEDKQQMETTVNRGMEEMNKGVK